MTAECRASLDEYVYMFIRYTIDKLSMCKWLHPNVVTLLGMVLLFPLFHALKNKSTILVLLILLVRSYLDNLDGELARKCNKTTKFGGVLDLVNDTIGHALLGSFILMLLIPSLKKHEFLVVLTSCFGVFYYSASQINIHTHVAYNNVIKALIDNSMSVYLGVYTLWLLLVYSK